MKNREEEEALVAAVREVGHLIARAALAGLALLAVIVAALALPG